MDNVIRTALPGYNAFTDTNLDHFSLYSDVDNVLIKRALTDFITIGAGATATIPHNLGYIPFFVVYGKYNDSLGDNYKLLNNQNSAFSTPQAVCAADATNLYITNFQGVALPVAYDIFYDDMSQTGNPIITESGSVIKLARPDKSTDSKNPNDYIMHSSLNNFKILKRGTATVNLASGDNTVAHGANIQAPYKAVFFIKFPDGYTLQVGNCVGYSHDLSKWVQTAIDNSNIHIYASGSFTVTISYIIYGSGVDDTINNQSPVIAVAKSGIDITKATNPDQFDFHSNYESLKYFESDTWSMGTISNSTEKVIAHNLGYVPFFIGFVNDLSGFFTNAYAIAPYYNGRSTIVHPNQDIAAFMYADATNIYLKAVYQTNAVGTNTAFQWYYKLFKNNLGL